MKVSKEIQRRMHKIAELSRKIDDLLKEVDLYFINKGFNIDELRCGNGISLDELEYGNDITDEFCKHAENDFADDEIWDQELIKS